MSRVVYEFKGTLQVLSPLHVGSGNFASRIAVKGKEGSNAPPQVALIVRDVNEKPYIPATALKNLFLRIAKALGMAEVGRYNLFGTIKEANTGQDDKGQIGAIRVRGATFNSAPDIKTAPYVEAYPGELNPGVFVAARTRIDANSGTAKDGHLFFHEMVGPGATFDFKTLIEVRGERAASALELAQDFAAILHDLAQDGGHTIGKGTADGFGAVKLLPNNVEISRRMLDSNGDFTPVMTPDIWNVARTSPHVARTAPNRITLFCRGPFMVIDSSRPSEKGDGTPQIKAQRWKDNVPMLLGSELSGALRSRAEWLEARMKQGDRKPDPVVKSKADVGGLSPSQRLFGVTGFKGLITLSDIDLTAANEKPVTSVKLDRFSGAPVDNALFTSQTFIGVTLTFGLCLTDRGGALGEECEALYKTLLADIACNGLYLGHGGNKGFGWFERKDKEAAHAGR